MMQSIHRSWTWDSEFVKRKMQSQINCNTPNQVLTPRPAPRLFQQPLTFSTKKVSWTAIWWTEGLHNVKHILWTNEQTCTLVPLVFPAHATRNFTHLFRLFHVTRLRTRQNFELVHIIGPVQNFGPPARNFGPLRAEFAWREWRKTLGGHVANWAGLSGFSPRENKISHTFFIDFINKYSKVSNAHNSDDCHGVFNGGMLNKGWSFSRSRFDCLGLMHFFHG